MNSLKNSNIESMYAETFEKLFESIKTEIKPGDVLVFMSNGSFGGLIQKTADWLTYRTVVTNNQEK